MKNESYIKLYRKITDWEHYTDGNTMRVYMHLLLMAVHERRNVYGIILKRGQCISSSRRLSEDLCMCLQSVTVSLKKLKDSGEIITERACGGSNATIFTIVKYDEYQSTDSKKSRKSKELDGLDGSTDW